MASNDLVNFFNLMFDKRQAFDIAEGILQDKRGLTGRVSFVGNPVSQPVFIMGSAKDVSVGNRCLCVRPKTSAKWIVLGSFGTSQIGYLPQRSPEDGYEIYPPDNLTAESIIPGCCLWHWDSPPEKPIVFEIQTNTTAVESGAVTELKTRGSYYIVDSEDNLFIRVRSITSTYNKSSWSDWVECGPGTGSGGGTGTVTSVALSLPGELAVAGSPITTSGTFTVTWNTETANTIFAGPTTGSAAAPAFRALVGNDLPMEAIQDMIAAFVAEGANIDITYNDGSNTLSFAVTGLSHTDISDFTEATQDVVGAFVTNGANISCTYSDAGNTLTIAFTGTLATTVLTGILQAAQFPALTGDVTTVVGALATTLATVNSNIGSFTFTNVTVNAKGLITAASSSQLAVNHLLGRHTVGTGDIESIALGTGLYIVADTLYASGGSSSTPSTDATLLEMIWIGGF